MTPLEIIDNNIAALKTEREGYRFMDDSYAEAILSAKLRVLRKVREEIEAS